MVLVPNVTIVAGSRGALVVDTRMGAKNAQAIMREVEKKEGETVDETVRTLQNELQGRYNRNQMASAVRAADNEAQ